LERIRVMLGQMPPMLRAVVHDALADQPDIAVVADDVALEAVVETAASTRAGVAVFVESDAAGDAAAMMEIRRWMPVILLATNARRATVHVPLVDLGPGAIALAIRQAADLDRGTTNSRLH